jgi:hypothetical protein
MKKEPVIIISGMIVILVGFVTFVIWLFIFYDDNGLDYVDLKFAREESSWDDLNKLAEITVTRGTDNANITGFNLIFEFEKNTLKHYINEKISEGEKKNIKLNFSSFNEGKLEIIKIVPVFNEKEGIITDEMTSEEIPKKNLAGMQDFDIPIDNVGQKLCTPTKTCSDYVCGSRLFDGCRNALNCGCPSGKVCVDRECVVCNRNITCQNYYDEDRCGSGLSDGCSNVLDCGCPSGKICVEGKCVEETEEVEAPCVPKTCADYVGQCGAFSNSCGGTINCVCTSGDCIGGFCILPPSGTTYYVNAVSGSDSNSGQASSPWKTMAKVSSSAQANSNIIILNWNDALVDEKWPTNQNYKSNKVYQYGIEWTFNNHEVLGRFANGDFWVVGPVNIIKITPQTKETSPGEMDVHGRVFGSAHTFGSGNWAITPAPNWYSWSTARISSSDTTKISVGTFLYVSGTGNRDIDRKHFKVASKDSTGFVLNLAQGSYTWGSVSGGAFGGHEIHGSMINPSHTSGMHGYVSSETGYETWNPKLNVAWGVSSSNPLNVPAGSSLISTESRVFVYPTNQNHVQKAAILTVLGNAPPANSFRPPYYGTDKTIRFNANNLDYSSFKRLAHRSGMANLTSGLENQFKRPWIRSNFWLSRRIHPSENMKDYYFYQDIGDAMSALNLDFSNSYKEKLLIYFSQTAIDWFEPYRLGRKGDGPDGGVFLGFMPLFITAGHALNYDPMINIFEKSGNYRDSQKPSGGNYRAGDLPPDYVFFQELDQTFYVNEHYINFFQPPQYTSSDIGLPEYAIRYATHIGWSSGRVLSSPYQGQNSGNYIRIALPLLIMGFNEKLKYNAFFDYVDRWVSINGGNTAWNTYRNNYGCTWTRDNPSDAYSQGHYNCNGELFRCNWAKSTVGKLINSCSDYGSNQRARRL